MDARSCASPSARSSASIFSFDTGGCLLGFHAGGRGRPSGWWVVGCASFVGKATEYEAGNVHALRTAVALLLGSNSRPAGRWKNVGVHARATTVARVSVFLDPVSRSVCLIDVVLFRRQVTHLARTPCIALYVLCSGCFCGARWVRKPIQSEVVAQRAA